MNAYRRLLTPLLILLTATTATFTVIGYDSHQRGSRPPARSAQSYWQRPAPQPAFLKDVPRVFDPNMSYPLLVTLNHTEVNRLLNRTRQYTYSEVLFLFINGRQVSNLNVLYNVFDKVTFMDASQLPIQPGLNVARIEFVDSHNQMRFYEWAFCVPGGEIDCEA